MSTIEIAHSILNRFSEEELNRFIAYFGIIYPVSDTDEIKETSDFPEFEAPTDDITERRAAFERIEQLRRPMPDLDEKSELASYREEKYGNGTLYMSTV